MDAEQFELWTRRLVEEDQVSAAEAEDAVSQRARFDSERALLEREFPGRVVGFVAGERLVADSTVEILEAAASNGGGGRQLYFEPIAESLPDLLYLGRPHPVEHEARWPLALPVPLALIGGAIAALALAFLGVLHLSIVLLVVAYAVAFVAPIALAIHVRARRRRARERDEAKRVSSSSR